MDEKDIIRILKPYMMVEYKYGNGIRVGFKHKVMRIIAKAIMNKIKEDKEKEINDSNAEFLELIKNLVRPEDTKHKHNWNERYYTDF